jgi:DHA1 family bicyclomycin/chloramphenicol resistance-like MFS transporter
MACALADHAPRAASASAAYGVLQFGSAAAVSALVGAVYDGTARPMAATMMAAALIALAAYRRLARRARPAGF